MAEIAKSGEPSLASTVPAHENTLPLIAGEAIAAGDACRLATDGRAYRASGAAADANARVRGLAFKAASAGEAVTLLRSGRMKYGAGMVPGTPLFLSGTVAGGLADAASVGGTTAIAFVVDATRIQITL
jgi:hypothetical protein